MTINAVKRVAVFVGAIALSGLVPIVALADMKPTSSTNTRSTNTPAVQNSSSIVEQLNLSQQQKNKIRGIRAARTRQINQVLKPDQQTKLQAELKSGKKLGEALQSLNLDSSQKKQILTIVQKSNQSVMATLDQNQQQKLEAYLKQRRQSRTQTPID